MGVGKLDRRMVEVAVAMTSWPTIGIDQPSTKQESVAGREEHLYGTAAY
jgi:hypothetical protein